jgi:hypothetical protein
MLSSATENIGMLQVCGQSNDQFVNASYDGNALAVGDSVFVEDNINGLGFLFSNYGTGSDTLYFGIPNSKSTGTSPLQFLWVYKYPGNGSKSFTNTSSLNFNLTEYPTAIGQFYAGNFSGTVIDYASQSHTITCSFRVRKNQ